ncbi:MAG: hypothetical protein JO128_05760 [Alphaproteobacteria bacterium]|nr:hypothetical protein [Alphaproteobacteria bacterium]
MGSVVWVRVAALGTLTSLALYGCGNPQPLASVSPSGASPGAAVPVSAPAPRIIRRFVGIPMPPNNVLDVDRTVIVGGDTDWLGRIFFAAPMPVEQAIDFYRREMPRYGWTELAITRSDTSVLAYQMGSRLATIVTHQTTPGSTQVEFWVNPLRARETEQAAQPAEPPMAPPPAAVPSSFPRAPIDGTVIAITPRPRAVDQAPLPPP